MAKRRTVLEVNPSAPNGQLGRRWSALAAELRRELGYFEEAITEAPGDATRLTREALDGGADVVVADGGDGTINEVVNGFFDGDRPLRAGAAFGVLPFGTGGDFRQAGPLPTDPAQAARVLAPGPGRPIA